MNVLIKKYNLLFHPTFYPPGILMLIIHGLLLFVNTFKIHHKLYQDCKYLYISAYRCIENQYCYGKVFEKNITTISAVLPIHYYFDFPLWYFLCFCNM